MLVFRERAGVTRPRVGGRRARACRRGPGVPRFVRCRRFGLVRVIASRWTAAVAARRAGRYWRVAGSGTACAPLSARASGPEAATRASTAVSVGTARVAVSASDAMGSYVCAAAGVSCRCTSGAAARIPRTAAGTLTAPRSRGAVARRCTSAALETWCAGVVVASPPPVGDSGGCGCAGGAGSALSGLGSNETCSSGDAATAASPLRDVTAAASTGAAGTSVSDPVPHRSRGLPTR